MDVPRSNYLLDVRSLTDELEDELEEVRSLLFPTNLADDVSSDDEPPHKLDVPSFCRVKSLIRRKDCTELLKLASEADESRVKLMKDPLLSVVITTHGKTDLALQLIKSLSPERLGDENFNGDTALHIAATVGDYQVAKALLNRDVHLVEKWNKKLETPLHKAALHGQRDMFWCMMEEAKDRDYLSFMRREDGATILHCAIMGSAPVLALEIANKYPRLITSRNDLAVTPLQLMVTIPDLLRNQQMLGPLHNFLYDWIPLEEEREASKASDEESPPASSELSGSVRSKFPSQYETLFDLLELIRTQIVAPIMRGVLKFLKQFSSTLQDLEKLKMKHKQALQLVKQLAVGHFDFYHMGYTRGTFNRPLDSAPIKQLVNITKKVFLPENITKKVSVLSEGKYRPDVGRWHESPLIIGTKLGLADFVQELLRVCPESATYVGDDGTNVLQTALKYRRMEIVNAIDKMTRGNSPVLRTWLCCSVDEETRNNILHFAADKVEITKGDALQLHDEIKWFEMVQKIFPEQPRNYRNSEEKTAQEHFTEEHEEMLDSCKTQLIEMGKVCSGLLAAVVFASSFSIPGDKDPGTSSPLHFNRLAFKIFSHAFVIGFACSATSLVLFLSFVVTSYTQQDFRRAVPMKYFFACLSFAMALLAFLISFACNVFLQIYGGKRTKMELIPPILELTVFPTVCFIVLLCSGAKFTPSFSRLWKAI